MARRLVAAALVVLIVASCAEIDRVGPRATPPEGASSTTVRSEPSGRPGLPSVEPVEPITGYGDFSSSSYWGLDSIEVTALQVECANDHGVPARLLPPGDGYSLDEVDPRQLATARAILDACLAGLNLPSPQAPSEEQLAELYGDLLEVKECLEAEGYTVEPPPSLGLFIESYKTGPWHPYNSLPNLDQAEWERLNDRCPQP